MASITETLTVCVDEATQNPTDILKSLEEREKVLEELKGQHQGSNLAEGDIQDVLNIIPRMKESNQNLLHANQETEKKDEEKERAGKTNDRGRARELDFGISGGNQAVYGVGGSESLEEIENDLVRLNRQHQYQHQQQWSKLLDREIQKLLEIVKLMKTNQNLSNAIEETKMEDEKQEGKGMTIDIGQSSGGRAGESTFHIRGGTQSGVGIGGYGYQKIRIDHPVYICTPTPEHGEEKNVKKDEQHREGVSGFCISGGRQSFAGVGGYGYQDIDANSSVTVTTHDEKKDDEKKDDKKKTRP